MHETVYGGEAFYRRLAGQVSSLCEASPLPLPSMANTAALLWESLPDINWAGFYLLRNDTLVLGPFQGKPACVLIPVGRGVCGTACAERKLQLVPDVHQFPGHIACDSASQSEIVVPLMLGERLLGVLDIDSPSLHRFTEADAAGLEALCQTLLASTDWSGGII